MEVGGWHWESILCHSQHTRRHCVLKATLGRGQRRVFMIVRGLLPWWLSGKEFACLPMQETWSDPWSGQIPHAVEQLSPCPTAIEPVLQNPGGYNY